MHIASIQITNYKSYRESSELKLTTGINIITGQNNAGKTALLEALSLSISDKPHRSLATVPQVGKASSTPSALRVSFRIDQDELRALVLVPGREVQLAQPKQGSRFSGTHGFTYSNTDEHRNDRLITWLLGKDIFRVAWHPGIGLKHIDYEFDPNRRVVFSVDANGMPKFDHYVQSTGSVGPSISLAQQYQRTAYSFRAERFNLGICAFGPNTVLRSDASNLAEVLSNLQSNPFRFRKYNETLHRVLSQIRQVTVRNLSDNKVELLTWPHDPSTERLDLAVPLDECGTGVGQVLAMLYVVLNSDSPRTILIDEPQSFLHPGAVRKLIEVFKEHPQHQYILTTHSPTVIAAANPSTITLVTQRDGASDFVVIDPAENEQLRRYLVDIGARLSDAFGADDVLWVEGPTEEICVPIILEKVARKPLLGTAIIAVNSTGDLEGRHAKTVFEIYERLSKAKGLLPPAVGFVFDKEERTEKQMSDIRTQSNGVVTFTPRRLYENYLLNPRAIAAVINEITDFREKPVTDAEVDAWIRGQLDAWREGSTEVKRHKYFASASFDGDRWKDSIHGAKLLERLFTELSETRVSYQKTEHSVRLTQWIAEHAPEDLRELADLLSNVLDKGRERLAPR
ncbi:AAA family ATPase [Polyangium sp. y55x31]|uniref:ATP-dependent nuclease n=1 Tax=Polyangium sp. y55x31 TaxID=3042688 RepID=UPI00248247F2|nr:AAA family ATPase [Polyangium sp. y55x31]MDI1478228.1 AAA family ATPase [Polyangium sp. y55x31]